MVDRLAEAELVERRADPTDRRAWLLHLTPRARTLLDDMRRMTDRLAEEATEGLSAAERSQLIALVGPVRCNLSRRDPTKQTGTQRVLRDSFPPPDTTPTGPPRGQQRLARP